MEEMFHPDISDADSNTCTFSCISRCDKNIYYNANIKSNIEVCMFNRPLNHLSSYEDACSVRELRLENILNTGESESQITSTMNIDGREKDKILERVFNYELSDPVQHFADKYDRIFGVRNNFLWKWLGAVFKEAGTTLSTVDKKYLDSLTDNKILLSLLYTIIDDIADISQDMDLLKKMLRVLNNNANVDPSEKNEKILLVKKIWDHILNEISKYPRFEEFKDVFMYDFKQVLNSTEYSCLVNSNPNIINPNEMEIYDCHGMIVFLINGIDLMASPKFDNNELPHLRTVFWHAQQMARIGNWLSTWKRELKEKDISSGIFARALTKEIIDKEDLEKLTEDEIISKIESSDIYEHLLNVWKQNREKITPLKDNINSVNIDAYIEGLNNVIKFHMASEGLK